MTVVLVHGVPETSLVWDELVAALCEGGVVAPIRLSPPGFGVPIPQGFEPTREGYVRWLIDELESLGEPVRLVGHDWGGLHVVGVAMTRPDLIESWVSDVVGIFDPGYRWHPLARRWQRPGAGEQALSALVSMSDDERIAYLCGQGMPRHLAGRLECAIDATMSRCILSLYRSAIQPAMAEAAGSLPAAAARPGLAIHPTEDHNSGTREDVVRSARRAGARVAELPGLGHWWFAQEPRRAATALHHFWGSR
ncbi:alpha/beta fold hydrolase [Mycolicibacterium madagascariense]|uniref:alpha/beta fold hydrolase n=1 Tax=Mycolicibacterium madagascariense TaxID=212765 RepID=UPI0013D6B4FC|nr:alpha/beta hydrolase [Mycolicibacterium madagascariense]MCV7015239.1 alpha/beta hydrolase [Mycolicibacterium madagascariense]